MALGSGLASSLGFAAETTYGTYVAPTRHLEFASESLVKQKTTMQGGGLAGGQYQQRASRRVLVTQSGSGSVSMEVTNKRMGVVLAQLMGSSTAPVQQGATAAYLQTHAIGDNFGKSMTIQKGVPDTTGTVRPYSFLGCKVTAAEFSCAVGETLQMTMDVDARDVTEAQTLAAPSYTTGLTPFHFGQLTVKLGTFGSEAAVTSVKSVSLRIERPMATERFYAGASGLKAEPIMNDYLAVTGSFETDFVDKTIFADRFASDTATSLVLDWTGPVLGSANERFTIKQPAIFLEESTPAVGGPDVVSASFSFTGQFDGTNLTTIEYMSADTTV